MLLVAVGEEEEGVEGIEGEGEADEEAEEGAKMKGWAFILVILNTAKNRSSLVCCLAIASSLLSGMASSRTKDSAHIRCRDVVADSTETIDKAVKTVQEHGFINYYGMQRFGIAQIPTHVIGLLLLRSEWELACDTILSAPREGEQYSAREARRLWREDKDAEGALKVLPKGHVAERCCQWRKGCLRPWLIFV